VAGIGRRGALLRAVSFVLAPRLPLKTNPPVITARNGIIRAENGKSMNLFACFTISYGSANKRP
ncbi:MAG: hypothetical protein AAB363_06415, partial [Planctomycetota bacterium]